jgi:hypothetical protein
MSRTDKTDPYYVKTHRYGIEKHNHSRGECDYDENEFAHGASKFPRWRYGNTCTRSVWEPRGQYWKNFSRPSAVHHEATRQHRAKRRKVKAQIHHEKYEEIDNHGTERGDAEWVCW